jgi:hypothetical protein
MLNPQADGKTEELAAQAAWTTGCPCAPILSRTLATSHRLFP